MRTAVPPTTVGLRPRSANDAPITQERVSVHTAPADFTEFYQRYYGYVVRLVSRRGISPANAEDVAQIILTHFFRHNALADYDPERLNSEGQSARFTTFLSGFVITYLQHHLNRARIEAARTESLDLFDGDPLGENSWINLQGPRVTSDFSGPEYDDFIREAHRRLREEALAADFRGCDLVEFFDAMREQVSLTGSIDTAALAEQFGVAVRTVQKWVQQRVRTALEGM